MAHQPKIRADELIAPRQGDIGIPSCRSQMLGQTDPDGLFRRQNKLRTGISVAIISPHMEHILQPWMRNAVVSGKGYQLGGAVGWQAVEPALCGRNTGAIDHDSGSDIRRQG
ncbi:hypothetical protein D3C78_1269430 [compost metagenome]